MDDVVIGQIGRPDRKKQKAIKIEITGQLTRDEWLAFVECVTACVRKFPGKLKLTEKSYSIKVKKTRKVKKKG